MICESQITAHLKQRLVVRIHVHAVVIQSYLILSTPGNNTLQSNFMT